ncbi:MAG: Programmed cell death toxin YdcE [uncultured Sulfurovum sp.]|uniref:Programmed cell death toxin YdcE n=1 Tax=uncultured Sulfurovum sp. TaxID=269237 RepID=A0A6S6TMT0_9BACT|nr:MAG: Programmed cell death toxin YdcE [uncultured Sulfurovum sp.]
MHIKRGEIYLANLGNVKHTDIGKIRPVLIFQNDNLNRMISDGLYADVIVIPLSSQIKKNDFTVHIKKRDRLEKDSTLLCNAVKMIHAKRLMLDDGILTTLNNVEIKNVEARVSLVFGMDA